MALRPHSTLSHPPGRFWDASRYFRHSVVTYLKAVEEVSKHAKRGSYFRHLIHPELGPSRCLANDGGIIAQCNRGRTTSATRNSSATLGYPNPSQVPGRAEQELTDLEGRWGTEHDRRTLVRPRIAQPHVGSDHLLLSLDPTARCAHDDRTATQGFPIPNTAWRQPQRRRRAETAPDVGREKARSMLTLS